MNASIAHARSALFVPGNRPDRFVSAALSAADMVILDLEDSVSPADKDRARREVADWLVHDRVAVVRINAAGTEEHHRDLEMVRAAGCHVMLPKADSAHLVLRVRSAIAPRAGLIGLVETARGVLNVRDICATGAVDRLCFGSVDLATELAIPHVPGAALTEAAVALVMASAAHEMPQPMDGVTTSLDEPDELAQDIVRGRALGFAGKLAIHPRHAVPINDGYSPQPEEVVWATSVLAADNSSGVASLDGHMIDRPVLERARRIVAHNHLMTNGAFL